MTDKEKIIRVMNKLPDNATLDDAIYRLEFLQSIEEGAKEAEQGLGIDHEEAFAELLKDDAKNETDLDAQSPKSASRNKAAHSQGRAKNRRKLHKTA